MTRKQFYLILALHEDYKEAFDCLSKEIKEKYYDLLNGMTNFIDP